MGVRVARVNWYKRHTAHPLFFFPPSSSVFSLRRSLNHPQTSPSFSPPPPSWEGKARSPRGRGVPSYFAPIKMPRGARINLECTSIPSNPTRPDKCTFLQIEIEDRAIYIYIYIGLPFFPRRRARFRRNNVFEGWRVYHLGLRFTPKIYTPSWCDIVLEKEEEEEREKKKETKKNKQVHTYPPRLKKFFD